MLEWIENGDTDFLPIMMSDPASTAASIKSIKRSDVTPADISDCTQEFRIWSPVSVGHPSIFDTIEFMSDFEEIITHKTDNGVMRRFRSISTPKGDLTEIFKLEGDTPAMWLKNFVTTEKDLPALTCLVERAVEIVLTSNQLRERTINRFKEAPAGYPRDFPRVASIGIPAFDLLSNRFTSAEAGLFLLSDNRSVFEHFFAIWQDMLPVWIKWAAEAGAHFVRHAINGLELYSPDIYKRYFVPQTQELHKLVHEHQMRSWIHTCGWMRQLIDMDIYRAMDVDVLESLSHPPLGDVADLIQARKKLGPNIVTRGGINVELFYEQDLQKLRRRIRDVVVSTRGYMHMIGDTNGSYPPYPRENILTLIDEIRRTAAVKG